MKACPKTIGTSNVRIIRVTPEDAIELLSSNFAGQRKIKKTNVTRLAKSMSDGKWDPYLGDLIRMTRDGVLVDGQHRLEAVVQSEVTCDFLFSNDFDVSDFPYIDTGVSRRPEDALVGVPSKKDAAALSKVILNWEERGLVWNKLFTYPRTNGEIAEFMESNEGARVVDAIKDSKKAQKALGGKTGSFTALALVCYLARKVDEMQFEGLLARLKRDNELFAEKMFFMRSAVNNRKFSQTDVLSLTATIWNDHLEGFTRKCVRVNPEIRMNGVNTVWDGVLLEAADRV